MHFLLFYVLNLFSYRVVFFKQPVSAFYCEQATLYSALTSLYCELASIHSEVATLYHELAIAYSTIATSSCLLPTL